MVGCNKNGRKEKKKSKRKRKENKKTLMQCLSLPSLFHTIPFRHRAQLTDKIKLSIKRAKRKGKWEVNKYAELWSRSLSFVMKNKNRFFFLISFFFLLVVQQCAVHVHGITTWKIEMTMPNSSKWEWVKLFGRQIKYYWTKSPRAICFLW